MNILKKYSKKQLILAAAVAFFVIVAAVYIGFSIYFSSHFWFRTTINGVDSSGKTVKDVEALITAEIDGYRITLEERGGGRDEIKSTDIGLAPEFDGSLQKEMKAQSGFAWIKSLFQKSKIEVETMVNFDDKKFDAAVKGLKCLDSANVTKPKDAYVSEYSPEKGYEVISEEEGNQVSKKKLKKILKSSITNLQETVSLEEEGCYVEPKYRSDDEKLLAQAAELNKYVKAVVTYEFGGSKETLDGSTISKWLSVDENGQVVLDEAQASQYVSDMASKYDTAYKPKSLKTSYGSTVTISDGDYGWRMDKEGETAQLTADIKEGKTVSREPQFKQRASSFGANDYGDTYVEINLTAQHLFFYKNGSLVVDSDLVSGNLAKGYDTPAGAYGITYTQRDATLRGEGYATPVDYWMPFNGGVGLHDANWRSDFGGSYYKNSGSHGCVNLPHSVAQTIFENIKTGDPVLVYELPGTESSKASAQDAASAVISAISAIGDVTLDSGGAISDARGQYDALSDEEKGYVSNYDTLVNSEQAYAELVAQQQAVVQADAQAKADAQTVIDAINSIGEVTADKEEAITNARNMYNALSDAAKPHVTNLNVLEAAEAALAALKEEQEGSSEG